MKWGLRKCWFLETQTLISIEKEEGNQMLSSSRSTSHPLEHESSPGKAHWGQPSSFTGCCKMWYREISLRQGWANETEQKGHWFGEESLFFPFDQLLACCTHPSKSFFFTLMTRLISNIHFWYKIHDFKKLESYLCWSFEQKIEDLRA